MAMSCQFVKQSDQVQVRASFFGKACHGCSSSQASLAAILRTISTFPPCGTIKQRDLDARFGEGLCRGQRRSGIDLNLRLGSSMENDGDEDDDVLTACSAVGRGCDGMTLPPAVVEKGSEGECGSDDLAEKGELHGHEYTYISEAKGTEIEERTIEVSGITNLEVQGGCEETDEGEDRKIIQEGEEEGRGLETKSFGRRDDHGSEGYMGLLIEAANLFSGDFTGNEKNEPEAEVEEESQENKPSQTGGVVVSHELGWSRELTRGPTRTESTKRCREEYRMADLCGRRDNLEVSPPVVRSKRGRSQVLPHRFRDSVLDPWKPLSRPRPNLNLTRRRSRR